MSTATAASAKALVPSVLDNAAAVLLSLTVWLSLTVAIPAALFTSAPRLSALASAVGVGYLLYSIRPILRVLIAPPPMPPYVPALRLTSERRVRVRRVFAIVNPSCGGGRGKSVFETECAPALAAAGITVVIHVTRGYGDARSIMTSSADAIVLCDAVAVAGGDGTLHEVVNGMFDARERYDRRIPIAVIPVGTGNGVSLSIGARTAATAVERLIGGHISAVDVNEMSTAAGHKLVSVNTILFGLLADVAVQANAVRWIGARRYDVMAVWALLRGARVRLHIAFDGERVAPADYVCAFVNNNSFFAKELRAAPAAQLDDGFMDVLTLATADQTAAALFALFLLLPTGRHYNERAVHSRQCRALSITVNDGGAAVINVDGENVVVDGAISIRCAHGAIDMFAGAVTAT